ncbi:MAG: (2Fe-2S)-binding protein [Xanthobacteraceae bacterium]|nr:(2Fe-2S)-binding protein [Xanthobacteraceae bacterium]QYK45162.1 MAG: (2Fe-2S)-binding protein [Xanthobacteraceae bacterium]
MKRTVSLTVNGVTRSAEVEPRTLLVHFLREHLHLTGTHVGCDTTQCGACTVRMNDQAVKSCTVFAVQAEGAKIVTVEGLAQSGNMHPIQEAFREHHGLQCGFCTPGMMMAATQLLDRYPDPTLEQIKHQLDGNICRCTGYHSIIKAVQSAAEKIRARKATGAL